MVITNVAHYETSSMSITPSSCQKKTFIRIRDTVSIWIKSTSSILTLTIGFMDHTLDRIHTNGDNIWKTTYEEQTKIGLNDLGSLFFLTILYTALTLLMWIPHVLIFIRITPYSKIYSRNIMWMFIWERTCTHMKGYTIIRAYNNNFFGIIL